MRRILSDAERVQLLGDGAVHHAHLLALAHQRARDDGPAGDALRARLEERIALQDRRFDALRGAEPPGVTRSEVERRERLWGEGVRPLLQRIAALGPESRSEDLAALDARVLETVSALEESRREARSGLHAAVDARRRWGIGLFALLIAAVAGTFVVARRVAARIASVSRAAQRIAAGEDGSAAVPGRDEVAVLGRAFDDMTARLRRNYALEKDARAKLEELFRTVGETAARLASAANEILAQTAEQARGAQQQLAAVSETTTSLDAVARTSDRSAARARDAADTARRSDELSRAGHGAVDEAVETIGKAKAQADGVARSILELAEQANAIGDITALIDDLAEQTNVLALNAAIEATRAGEHGKGFSVVAAEVKSLADQSRRATAEARSVLGDVQKRANRTVLSTEDSTRSLEAAVRAAQHAGQVIRELSELGARLSGAVAELAQTAAQHATGIGEITQAVREISNVASQYVSSTRQSEAAVRELTALGDRLRQALVTTGR
jgi:methyl-accepting chemotaxis protein